MPDLDHLWGNDLAVGPTGDLAVVDGTQLGIQRVLRRLMTRGFQAPVVNSPGTTGELIYHQDYGAGILLRIGQTLNIPLLKSVVRSQILLEAAVAKSPAPIITVTAFPDKSGATIDIKYNDAVTGEQTSLSFDVNG